MVKIVSVLSVCFFLILGPAQAHELAVASAGTDTLDVLDTKGKGSVTNLARFSDAPFDVVASADGTRIYVSAPGNNEVGIVSPTDGPIASINIGVSPRKMTLNGDGTRLYVATSAGVTVIDTASNTELSGESIALAENVNDVAVFGPFLGVGGVNSVYLFDVSSSPPILLASREIGLQTLDIAFSPGGTKLYAIIQGSIDGTDENGDSVPSGNVHVLRVSSLALKTILIAGFAEPQNSALAQDGRLHITTINGDLVSIDTATDAPPTTLAVGADLRGIGIAGSTAYVTDPVQGVVHEVTLGKNDRVTRTYMLPIGAEPLGIAVLSGGQISGGPPVKMDDNFNDSVLNTDLWFMTIDPPDVGTIIETNQRLEMTHLNAGQSFLGLVSKCTVSGDFDARVDYALINWPAQNSHTVRFATHDLTPDTFGHLGIYRNSAIEENYQFRADEVIHIATTDMAGTMRLTRTGSTVSGYRWDGTQFVLLGSATASINATAFVLDTSTPESSAPGNIGIAFDNFKVVKAGAVSCPQ